MVIIGLDPGTRLGWGRIGGPYPGPFIPISWGVEDFTPKKGADEAEGVRFRRVADFLPSILDGASAVAIENWTSSSMRAAAIGNGIVAIILVECERQGIEYAFVAPSSLKKFATGHGGSKKNPVTKEDVRRTLDGWGPITSDTVIREDASDALVAARWLASTYLRPKAPEVSQADLGF